MPLTLGTNDGQLRQKLAEITRPADAAGLKKQIEEMSNLGKTHPHSINLVREIVPGSPRFSCHQYAFGLSGHRFRLGILQIFPGRDFVAYLLETQLEEIPLQEASDGDHIVYSGSQIEHSGIVQAGSVQSKWGTGHIWRHGVYEIPDYYGDTVRFFRAIAPDSALQGFMEFEPRARVET